MLTSLTFYSCLDDDGYSLGKFWIDIATVESKPGSSQSYFKLDDGTTLWPASGYYIGHNLEEGQRIILNYTILSDTLKEYSHYIKVNNINTILTKKIAEDKADENDEYYGTDPVKVNSIWVGDKYLNINFGANYGGEKKHFVNLVPASQEENPYYFEFRHNAYDDPSVYGANGFVCFDLSEIDTEGETITLVIAFKTFDGDKTFKLEYNSTTQKVTNQSIPSDMQFEYIDKIH